MITLLYFGQIKSITSLAKEQVDDVQNLEELNNHLLEAYPKLKTVSFVFAVNKNIQENCELKPNDEVALLPPFSGG